MDILGSNRIKELEEKLCRIQLDNIQLRQEKSELQDEIVRLTGIISAKTENCQVGPWCNGCVNMGISGRMYGFENKENRHYFTDENGSLIYCKKYLSELCSEYTSPYGRG